MEKTLNQPADPFLVEFERLLADEAASAPLWLRAIRKSGFAHFSETGLPAQSQEEWKYTNLDAIRSLPFKPAWGGQPEDMAVMDQDGLPAWARDTNRLVFINGQFVRHWSNVAGLADGMIVSSLRKALTAAPALIEQHLARYAHPRDNPFVALNAAFFQDGALIHVPQGASMVEPLHIIHLATRAEAATVFHPRHLVIAGPDSRLALVETYLNLSGARYLTNSVTEIILEPGSQVEHCKIVMEGQEASHVATVQAQQASHSVFKSHSIALGAGLARHDIRALLNGEGADCLMNGLYLARGGQVVDHHTVIDHAMPHCTSHEFYHGILAGASRGVFNGKIFVRKDAQKTDAKQTNRNLLLSENATIDTKPQLEIFADDVKCTHGATVGQLDEDAVFYLRARGIGEADARRMLVQGFAREILARIEIREVAPALETLVGEWLEKC